MKLSESSRMCEDRAETLIGEILLLGLLCRLVFTYPYHEDRDWPT